MAVSAADFEYVRQLVQDDSALVLADGKEYLVETRLAPLAKREGLGSVAELVDQLRAGAPGCASTWSRRWPRTRRSFFRDLHPFEALRDTVIPAVLPGQRRATRLTLWSAAARPARRRTAWRC